MHNACAHMRLVASLYICMHGMYSSLSYHYTSIQQDQKTVAHSHQTLWVCSSFCAVLLLLFLCSCLLVAPALWRQGQHNMVRRRWRRPLVSAVYWALLELLRTVRPTTTMRNRTVLDLFHAIPTTLTTPAWTDEDVDYHGTLMEKWIHVVYMPLAVIN